jgi:hypothetical protein
MWGLINTIWEADDEEHMNCKGMLATMSRITDKRTSTNRI